LENPAARRAAESMNVKIKTSSNNNPKENGELGTGTVRSFSFHGAELGNQDTKENKQIENFSFFLFLDGEHKAERGYPQRTVACSD
jgi:hypothetical protein